MDKKLIRLLSEALENDNPSAVRQIVRGANITPELALIYLWESAGLLIATSRTPKRSSFFDAVALVGNTLDSEAIAWGNLEQLRRANRSPLL
jgi:hypothetical protein